MSAVERHHNSREYPENSGTHHNKLPKVLYALASAEFEAIGHGADESNCAPKSKDRNEEGAH